MLKLVFQEGKWLKKLPWFTAAGAGISVFVIAALQFFTEWKWGLADIWPIFILITGSAVAFWAFCVGAVWAVTDGRRVDHMAPQLWLWAAREFEKVAKDIIDILSDTSKVWPEAQFWMLHRLTKLMFVFCPDPHWRYAPMQKTRFELVNEFCQRFEIGVGVPKYEVWFSGMEEGYFTNGGLSIVVKKTYMQGGELKTDHHRYYEDPYTNKTS